MVAGGADPIDLHLVDEFVARGAKVTVLDDFANGLESNLKSVRERIRIVRGDILSADDCGDAIAGAAFMSHEAALGSVPRLMKRPVTTLDVNARGTATVFAACRDAGGGRVVNASGSSWSPSGSGPDRVISTVGLEAHQGPNHAARGSDGSKGHLAIDPDSEIVVATVADSRLTDPV